MLYCRSVLLRAVKRQVTLLRKNSSKSIRPAAEKWDLFCGICLERKPSITRPLNELEISFSKLLQKIESDLSKKSEHELRCEADRKRAIDFQEGKVTAVVDPDASSVQSGAEFEDNSLSELNAFEPASRITEADEKNDVKSTERLLDKHLLLIVNEPLGKDKFWLLPQDLLKEEETLREAAERILKEKFGSKVKAKFHGNAPCGFYKYKYPKVIREEKEIVGAKIFFMKAHYLKGTIQENKIEDYCWASRDELTKHFHAPYRKAISAFLIDDEPVNI